MNLTPEEDQKYILHKEKMRRRKIKVILLKLSLLAFTSITVFYIILEFPGKTVKNDAVHRNTAFSPVSVQQAVPETSADLPGDEPQTENDEIQKETQPNNRIISESQDTADSSAKRSRRTSATENAKTPETEPVPKTTKHAPLAASAPDSPYLEALRSMSGQDSRIQTVLDSSTDYPEDLLKILSNNIETLDFVLDYPTNMDNECADTVGDVVKGTIPQLLQWDERWGYHSYGGSIIAASGCGPTCLAMVASGLTGRNDITPAVVADYGTENGYLTEQNDTKWDLMSYGCEAFGITGTTLSLNEDAMREKLEEGFPIICSVRPGDFTNGGHFLVITGYQDGQFRIHDPNSRIRSEQLWDYDRLAGQIKNLWYYQLLEQ